MNAAPLGVGEFGARVKTNWVATPAVAIALNVTDVSPLTDAVNVCAPASVPRRHVTCAVPVASVVAVALALNVWPSLLTFPLFAPAANVTATFGTALPLASFTTTVGALGSVVFTVAVWPSPVVFVIEPGAPAVTVAVNAIGLPETPDSVAVTFAVPVVVGNVQPVSFAMPFGSVVTVAGLVGVIVPPESVNVTFTPGTGFCAASFTTTAGRFAVGTAVPTCPANCVGLFAEIDAAAPAVTATALVTDVTLADEKVIVTWPAGPVMPNAENVAFPLASVPTVAPVRLYGVGTDAITVTPALGTALPN